MIRTWAVNARITEELLALCPDQAMELKPGKGKTIRSNFVHLIGVRKMWCEEKLPEQSKQIPKLDWKSADRQEIEQGLAATDQLMRLLLQKRIEKPGKHPVALFLGYAIAHEANHRAQIEIALRLGGFEPEEKVLYDLWDWHKRLQ